MNRPLPAVVVSLPARTVAEVSREVAAARDAGADLAEVRVDRLGPGEFHRLTNLFPSPLPLIATLRSRAEGGEGPDATEERAELLTSIARHPFRWIDIELARDQEVAEAIRARGSLGLIVSSHSATPVSAAVWGHLIRAPAPKDAVRKVVVSASIGQLLRDLIPDLPPVGEVPLVALTTGASGPVLRVWSRRFGFPLVFASLPSNGKSTGKVEASQIPVNRLAPFLRADGSPPLFGLAGHRIAYSMSPELHSRWMSERDKVGLYVALDFENEREFVDSVPALVEGGFRGLNVTQPFKHVALELATDTRPSAQACGVANTLTFEEDGVVAENTDLAAVLRRLEELRSEGRWNGGTMAVVGGGGAARATLAAARSLRADAVLWARRDSEATRLASEFGARPCSEPHREEPELVVHATTVGREAAGSVPAPISVWARPGVHVLDWVYAPVDPAVSATVLRQGATYEDGMRLLYYQAAASFAIWWGEEPQVEPVLEVPEERS